MKLVPEQAGATQLPTKFCQNQGWENVRVEQFNEPPGEASCHYRNEHTINLSLATRPVRLLLQSNNGKTQIGLYGKGDISLMPANVPLFARWDIEDHYLQIRITSCFIQNVAREALDVNPDQFELLSEWRTRDPQIEAIAMLLLAERNQDFSGRLYVESLANVLAVYLLKNYTAAKPQLATYKGGLPQHQLLQILDYIDEHLCQDIKLADLAQLLGMSQFHFSHLFKQSIGTAPYQYLLQQRIEKAKQLLKQTDQPIIEIALLCGFNSHSHLSKQFRQLTGITPKAYRTN